MLFSTLDKVILRIFTEKLNNNNMLRMLKHKRSIIQRIDKFLYNM